MNHYTSFMRILLLKKGHWSLFDAVLLSE